MGLRRGFKTEANCTAREVRAELGLAADAPLCPFRLADLVGAIPVELSRLGAGENGTAAAAYLASPKGQAEFSAITICIGGQRLVIYNDGRPHSRVAADIAHELSHILLMHPPHRLCQANGERHYDPSLEAEASWLGPALLVSEEAAILVAKQGLRPAAAAAIYGVSPALMQMRLNVTGAARRVA